MPMEDLLFAFTADSSRYTRRLESDADGKIPLTEKVRQRLLQIQQQAQEKNIEEGVSFQALGELVNAKILRSAESNRQLQEVLVDFWSNHFNLDAKKGRVKVLLIADENDVIRPHVLGKFRDLLGASAKSPAMLEYLDNATSRRDSDRPGMQQKKKPNSQPVKRGINENYARELMELHTLGVDGGYTQDDIINVARCFTGWTYNRKTGEFTFNRGMHDNGEKTVLGQVIPPDGGIKDGEKVLDILASSPATARHLSYLLCQRFVADNPPEELVKRVADVWIKTDGDLRKIMRAIVISPEFNAPENYRTKMKSPYEYVISAVRAMGGNVKIPKESKAYRRLMVNDGGISARQSNKRPKRNVTTLAEQIAFLGQPLYSYQPPTGYSENSQTWISTGAVVDRLNYALALVNGNISNVELPPLGNLTNDSEAGKEAIVRRITGNILFVPAAATTKSTFMRATESGKTVDVRNLTALAIGSPEFQRK